MAGTYTLRDCAGALPDLIRATETRQTRRRAVAAATGGFYGRFEGW